MNCFSLLIFCEGLSALLFFTLFIVFLEGPTTFTVPLQEQTVIEKETATFTCEVSKPDKKVKWFKSGKEIIPDQHFTIDCDACVHRLTISNCYETDSAEYTAKIDRSKTSANLIVEGEILSF